SAASTSPSVARVRVATPPPASRSRSRPAKACASRPAKSSRRPSTPRSGAASKLTRRPPPRSPASIDAAGLWSFQGLAVPAVEPRQPVRRNAEEVESPDQPVRRHRACRAQLEKAAGRRRHRLFDQLHPAQAAQPDGEVQVLQNRPVAEAPQFLESLPGDELGLIAQRQAEKSRAPVDEPRAQALRRPVDVEAQKKG